MTAEKHVLGGNGWFHLFLTIGMIISSIVVFIAGVASAPILLLIAIPLFILAMFWSIGFFTLQPNESCLLTFFGPYIGTVRQAGFYWVNPFYLKRKISLRAQNLEGSKLKVNDKRGNPIEIAVVIVWRVDNTAAATFDVQNVDKYVHIQSESAVRHLAGAYAYDHGSGDDADRTELTLRESTEEVAATLLAELRDRLIKSGVEVDEARITHLAYAPEIASVMLRRQQAEAIIAARQKIVHGAVSMVEMALNELSEKNIVELDPERKAAMVNNLLVILCGESEARPVLNTGTLYGG
ncbi:MAG: SPFH domain-containing protein [Planctomycetota bacterium]|nr:MAG: SPFH domain-containing protein [Planctomycetota bacterium]